MIHLIFMVIGGFIGWIVHAFVTTVTATWVFILVGALIGLLLSFGTNGAESVGDFDLFDD